MSSVLVRGMKSPKNCRECPLNHDQMACKATGTRWWSDTMVLVNFDSDKERLYDCPLVEVKEPHGRLGDLDKMMTSLADWWYSSFGEEETDEAKAIKAVLKRIEQSLDDVAVIEAEGK